jgi:drug/metabolite transporter (DMT)-like permease
LVRPYKQAVCGGTRGAESQSQDFPPVKTKVSLAVIILTSAFGNVLLSKGMKQLGDISHLAPGEMLAAAIGALLNPWVAAGMVLLTVFFFSFLATLSWADLSYVLPATAPSYLLVAALSYWLLGEAVSPWRWLGTALIVAGVALVARTEVRTT